MVTPKLLVHLDPVGERYAVKIHGKMWFGSSQADCEEWPAEYAGYSSYREAIYYAQFLIRSLLDTETGEILWDPMDPTPTPSWLEMDTYAEFVGAVRS